MLSKIRAFVLNGLECQEVFIEADKGGGIHNFTLVGLPDVSVRESKERVTTAIKNSGFSPPYYFGRITVCLAPSYLRKTGCSLDFPLAVSLLEATGQIGSCNKEKVAYIGELALDGRLRDVPGILSMVIVALQKGYKKIFIPYNNFKEASLIKGIDVVPLKCLKDYCDYLRGSYIIPQKFQENLLPYQKEVFDPDLSNIKGQEKAKRALMIIASGGHNLLFSGSPGTGKTFLAKSLPSILPSLTFQEKLEITKIYSVAGLLPKKQPLISKRPFRSPHHTASNVALVGGGSKISPGEITLAHRGVLFLDEILEFSQKTLESLRQPLEDRMINVARASGSVTFPANFILIGAMNPCPCGYLNDTEKECSCTPQAIARYRQKLSGPIIDRIDLFVEVNRIKYKKLKEKSDDSFSKKMRDIVEKASIIQRKRLAGTGFFNNSEMKIQEIEKFCSLEKDGEYFLKKVVNNYHFSTRSYFRILKVARTIADLEVSCNIKREHLAEAVQYQLKGI